MSRVTQDTARPHHASDTGLSPSVTELSRTFSSHSEYHGAVLQPRMRVATHTVWALPRSLATTGGIIRLFSLPAGTKMFQFPAFASLHTSNDDRPSDGRVVPFGNPRVNGHLHLTAAYRSLSRPSSPPRAKASAMRPYILSCRTATDNRRTHTECRAAERTARSYFQLYLIKCEIVKKNTPCDDTTYVCASCLS